MTVACSTAKTKIINRLLSITHEIKVDFDVIHSTIFPGNELALGRVTID